MLEAQPESLPAFGRLCGALAAFRSLLRSFSYASVARLASPPQMRPRCYGRLSGYASSLGFSTGTGRKALMTKAAKNR